MDGADGGDTDANGHLQSIAMPTGVPHAERTTSGQPAWEWRGHQFLNLCIWSVALWRCFGAGWVLCYVSLFFSLVRVSDHGVFRTRGKFATCNENCFDTIV